jgi:dihydropteroate synthase
LRPDTHPQTLLCGRFELSLREPLIMGVVNLTPDSFSDGGRFMSTKAALDQVWRLIEEGAHIIDLGAESSRPGAAPVELEEELKRVLPVLEGLRGAPVPISVDTTKAEVMATVIAAGASMVNDITALAAPGAVEAVASGQVAVCLMHMQGEPRSMQDAPAYGDVVRDVRAWLQRRVERALSAGVARECLVIDPGFGFGKTVLHNLDLLRHLSALTELGVPVLAGLSRKSLLGKITGRDVESRAFASVAAALIAVENGARIVRVHDVAATRDALRVWNAVNNLEFDWS